MRTCLAAVLLLAACGGKPPPSTPPGNGAVADPDPTPAGPPTIEQACTNLLALKASGCAFLQDYDADLAVCVEELQAATEDPMFLEIVACFGGPPTCGDAEACVDRVLSSAYGFDGGGAPPPPAYRACGDHDALGAVGFPRAEWNKRHGASARTFADAPTTKDRPIEVCEIRAQRDWLMRTRCNDGSNPFRDEEQAKRARVGSVGPGGRCSSIIDLYRVPCPEQTYEVYMDAYVCPID